MTKTYNGWSTYETWLVNLWMDNEQVTQSIMRALANDGGSNDSIRADALKDFVEELLPDLEGFAHDLMNAALSEVDWMEIIKNQQDEEN